MLMQITLFQDGGCTCPGDVSKAFGAGADFVMLGGMLAGHDESGGELIEKNGKKFKQFYGMASATAMKKYSGTLAEYRYFILFHQYLFAYHYFYIYTVELAIYGPWPLAE